MSQTKSTTVYPILVAIAIAHMLNDLIQAVIPAIYPQLEDRFQLSMTQVGMITLCYQIAASIFQPLVGNYTDKRPQPYSQVLGMSFSSLGVILLAYAPAYEWVLVAVFLVGIGSSIFHPESSRVAFLASGGKRSLAQSIFQIGGNLGTALAPILVVWIVLPNSQVYILAFLFITFLAKIILYRIGKWYNYRLKLERHKFKKVIQLPNLSKSKINLSIGILLVLIFSKYFYMASITSYFQFYTEAKFGFSDVQAQLYLFYFLFAVAIGTLLGGVLGDRFGRKLVIWLSILGAAPFTLMLPYANASWTAVLIIIIGLLIASAFPAILVFAQEILPKKIGMVSGLFYGFAFGMAGVASAVLGYWVDHTSITYVYEMCAYFPLLGLVAVALPNLKKLSNKV